MRRFIACFLILFAAPLLRAGDTDYESTWKDRSATYVDMKRQKTAVFLLSGDEAVRRAFEYNLALELRKKGIWSAAGYSVLPKADVTNKDEVLAALKETDAAYGMFMRIVDREKEVTYVPGSVWYPGPYYDRFWWYGGGFGPWPPYYSPGYYWVDTVVSVETLVYSVPDSKLIWAGLSRTVNPDEIDDFAEDLAKETVDEFEDMGVVRESS